MSVPNDFSIVEAVYKTGHYNLITHAGQAAFVDAAVLALHAHDPNWGHIKKKPGQTNIHGHAEDAAIYKLADGTARAVDFIAGAGGWTPTLYWNVGEFVYKHSDWLDPADHDGEEAPQPQPPSQPTYPSYEELGGDEGGKKITRQLEADFKRAGRPGLDGDCGAWQQRVSYDFLTRKVPTIEEAIAKHRKGWCDALGIPVTP
jgi:hypothetical protein